jgi:hypothetical protein
MGSKVARELATDSFGDRIAYCTNSPVANLCCLKFTSALEWSSCRPTSIKEQRTYGVFEIEKFDRPKDRITSCERLPPDSSVGLFSGTLQLDSTVGSALLLEISLSKPSSSSICSSKYAPIASNRPLPRILHCPSWWLAQPQNLVFILLYHQSFPNHFLPKTFLYKTYGQTT